jgi:hypothetical protein
MERVIAIIPLYELHEDLFVAQLNANKTHNVDEIKIWISYNVVDPLLAFKGIPNYTLVQENLAKEMKVSIDEGRINPAFWEKSLGSQIKHEAEEFARMVFHQNVFAQNAQEIYNSRKDLAEDIQVRLNEHVYRWGVKIKLLEIDRVKVDRDILGGINKKTRQESDTEDKRIESERDATRIRNVLGAEVDAEAQRVTAIITALRDSGVEITPDLIVKAITATSDWQMEGDFSLLTQQPPSPGAAPAAKPAEKK